MMEAENGIKLPQAKEAMLRIAGSSQKLEECHETDSPSRPQEATNPSDISGLQTSTLKEKKFLLF
jgi:hypothetical protein